VKLTIDALHALYESGNAKPSDVVAEIYDRIGREPTQPVWISLVPPDNALARARKLESDAGANKKPLYGIPFAIKDNIDLAGVTIHPSATLRWWRNCSMPARSLSARPTWISSPRG
jgi:Asp-tRNA(Asn)/Glu-tRNA(Gln) amidotransferase A subunit family amidase